MYLALLLCWAWFWLYFQNMRPQSWNCLCCAPLSSAAWWDQPPASPRTWDSQGKTEKAFCHGCYFVCFQSLYYWLQYHAAGIITRCVRAALSARSSGDLHLTQQWEGLPGGSSGKPSACQRRRHKRYRFDPWVGKISWRRKWQFTPVFLPSCLGNPMDRGAYSPWGCKELDMT